MPSRVSRSSNPVPPSVSTRRIATVVSSVPDAISASSSTTRFVAPPVPMMSREAKLRSAIVNFSATLHRRHYLQSGSIEKLCGPAGPRQHRIVHRHRDTTVRDAQRLQQRGDRGPLVNLDRLFVDDDDHALTPIGTSWA